MPADSIPVLRLDQARGPDVRPAAFLTALRTALHEVGFLQLTDYGARPGQVERADRGRGPVLRAAAGAAAAAGQPAVPALPRLHPAWARDHRRPADAREQMDFAPERLPCPARSGTPVPAAGRTEPVARRPVPSSPLVGWAELLGRVGRAHQRDRRGAGAARRPFRAVFADRSALVRQADPLRRRPLTAPDAARGRPARRLGAS